MKTLNCVISWDDLEYITMDYINSHEYLKAYSFNQKIVESLTNKIHQELESLNQLCYEDIQYRISDIIESYIYAIDENHTEVIRDFIQ